MIYLISGAPRVGKSILAAQLAEQLGIPHIDTDLVCDAYRDTLSDSDRATQFPFPNFSGDAKENHHSAAQLVTLQITSATSLEPELYRLIRDQIARHTSVVIEGIHLLPTFIHSLRQEYFDSFRTICIGSQDIDVVLHGLEDDQRPDNWMRESDADVKRQVAAFVIAFSERIHEEAVRLQLPYQERTPNFENDLLRFLQLLRTA